MDEQERKLVGLILNCKPDDLKGISLRVDGSLAVVAPNGMKFIFSPVELDNARDSFGLKSTDASIKPITSIPARQKTPRGADASSVTSTPTRQKTPCGADASSVTGSKLDVPSTPAQQKALRGVDTSSSRGNMQVKPVGKQVSGKALRAESHL